jgi:branched-chain amino acid transport system substrate-binding protein
MNAHGRRGLRAAAIGLALALTATACGGGGGGTAPGEPESYRVGALLGLTGAYAAISEPERQALELYVEGLNADGGINGRPVELVVADTGSNESEAVNQLRRLVTQEEVVAVIGPSSSGEAVALRPISTSLRVPVMAIAASNAIITPPAESPYMFKEFPASLDSLRAQLTYAQEQGWTRVAMLSSNNGYGQEPAGALPDMIGEFGLELVGAETFPPDATDMTPQLSALAGTAPDVTLVWAVNPANAVVARNARDISYPGALFQAPGAASAQYIELGGDAVEGTLLQGSKVLVSDAVAADDPQKAVLTDFVAAWQAEYDATPSQYAAGGWDSSLLTFTALAATDPALTDPQEVRDALRVALEATSGVSGVLAVYSFSPEQHGPQGIDGLAIIRLENGAFVLEQAY